MWLLLHRASACCARAEELAAPTRAAAVPTAAMHGIRFIILESPEGCVKGRIALKIHVGHVRSQTPRARPCFRPARILAGLSGVRTGRDPGLIRSRGPRTRIGFDLFASPEVFDESADVAARAD